MQPGTKTLVSVSSVLMLLVSGTAMTTRTADPPAQRGVRACTTVMPPAFGVGMPNATTSWTRVDVGLSMTVQWDARFHAHELLWRHDGDDTVRFTFTVDAGGQNPGIPSFRELLPRETEALPLGWGAARAATDLRAERDGGGRAVGAALPVLVLVAAALGAALNGAGAVAAVAAGAALFLATRRSRGGGGSASGG